MHIAAEGWGIFFCFIISCGLWFTNAHDPASRRLKLLMELCCIVLLASDSVAWAYRGQPGWSAYYAVRISNFIVFLTNYLYMSLFSLYLWRTVSRPRERVPRRCQATFALSAAAILLLTASQFNGMFYYFDAENRYHRGSAYAWTQIIAMAGILLSFTLLLHYRARLERAVFLGMLSYFVLPLAATGIQAIHYGLSLQNLAIVASTQIMLAIDVLDVSKRLDRSQTAYEEASHAAEHDAMTGLLNKTFGLLRIEEHLAAMTEADSAALVFLDVDNFKSINDTYGHSVGDFWIIEIARALKMLCAEQDIACRFGGDEFVLLVVGEQSSDELHRRVRIFREMMELSSREHGQVVRCSAGVCQLRGAGHTVSECIELADAALYEAKFKGKSTYCVFQAGTENIRKRRAQQRSEPYAAQRNNVYRLFEGVLRVDLETGECTAMKWELPHLAAPVSADSGSRLIETLAEELALPEDRPALTEYLHRQRHGIPVPEGLPFRGPGGCAWCLSVMPQTQRRQGQVLLLQPVLPAEGEGYTSCNIK